MSERALNFNSIVSGDKTTSKVNSTKFVCDSEFPDEEIDDDRKRVLDGGSRAAYDSL